MDKNLELTCFFLLFYLIENKNIIQKKIINIDLDLVMIQSMELFHMLNLMMLKDLQENF